MIAELGNYALALALALSVFLAVLPLIGAEKSKCEIDGVSPSTDLVNVFSIEPLVRCAILLVRR